MVYLVALMQHILFYFRWKQWPLANLLSVYCDLL